MGAGDTGFRSDGVSTIQIYSELLMRQALKKIFFGKFVGKSEDSLIQTLEDLGTKQGDKIQTTLVMNLSGKGRTDNQQLEGNEEQLRTHNFSTTVHLRSNAVRADGKMSLQRTIFDRKKFRMTARTALSNWLKDLIDDDTVLTLSGLANPGVIDDDEGAVAAVAPSTNRVWKGGQTSGGVVDRVDTDNDITNTDDKHRFGTKVISTVKRMAQLCTPIIRPVTTENGKNYYVMFIHPYQAKDLKADEDWLKAQREANVRGEQNPIFTGALGIFDGVVIHEYERLITRLGTETGLETTAYFESGDPLPSGIYGARGLFCGAQAGVHAWAQKPSWFEKDFDYDRVPGIATDIIYGNAKTKYNGEDFGSIAVDTAIVPDE